jgi:transposase
MEKPNLPEEKIEELPVEVRVYLAYLEESLKLLQAQVSNQQNKITELEGQLKLNSQDSSKPPSSDRPSAPPRPPKKQSGKKCGGQVGHTRQLRQLMPEEEVNELKKVVADQMCQSRMWQSVAS